MSMSARKIVRRGAIAAAAALLGTALATPATAGAPESGGVPQGPVLVCAAERCVPSQFASELVSGAVRDAREACTPTYVPLGAVPSGAYMSNAEQRACSEARATAAALAKACTPGYVPLGRVPEGAYRSTPDQQACADLLTTANALASVS